jgi:hypothetical protein
VAVNALTRAIRVEGRTSVRFRSLVPRVWILIALAVVVGLGVVLATTPIVARGDYGQWLMASRYYLGQHVPGYRTIPALPPFVPVALALLQLPVPDPVAALQVMNVALMVGLAASFFAVGTVVGRRPLVGVFSVLIGLLFTDRYLEMFAFGGLLQAASVMWTALAVAAFVRAGRDRGMRRRWWVAGSVALAFATLSHVGTGTVAVPAGLAVAGLSLLRLRHLGWRTLRHALVPVFVGLAVVGTYWLTVLLPASGDYVTNPASLGYRGPERLFSLLFEYWPTAVVIVTGAVMLVVGSVAELLRRSPGRHAVLAAWAIAAWGSLAVAIMTRASTDYPRFAPVLLAPLVPACALAAVNALRAMALHLHGLARRIRPTTWVTVSVVVTVLAAAPFAVERYSRQALTYQPLDARSLTSAVEWVDGMLPRTGLSVLTAVRDGKWLEGETGREALFSLPVRYAFRPTEWQRSVDAEAILRSTAALSNEFFFAKFADQVGGPTGAVPTGLLLGVNHGGEYVDLLQMAPRDTRISSPAGTVTASALAASAVERTQTDSEVAMRTDWHGPLASGETQLTQVVSLVRGGATLRLVEIATGGSLEVTLSASSVGIASMDIAGHEANVCFTQVGASQPCVRIVASQPDAVLEASIGGGLRVGSASGRLDLLVTDLTAGGPSIGLAQLDPGSLVVAHDVGAALLVATDPAYPFRRHRLEMLGFREVHRVGPYEILVRRDLVEERISP